MRGSQVDPDSVCRWHDCGYSSRINDVLWILAAFRDFGGKPVLIHRSELPPALLSPETACIDGAQRTVQAAIEELAAQLGQDDPIGFDVSLSIVQKAGTSCSQQHRSTCHYFVVSAQGESRILDPSWQPCIDPARHKMGVWMPYKWLPVDALSMTDLEPPEAITVCLETLKQP